MQSTEMHRKTSPESSRRAGTRITDHVAEFPGLRPQYGIFGFISGMQQPFESTKGRLRTKKETPKKSDEVPKGWKLIVE